MEYQIKDIFTEKSCRNVQQKLVPDLFIILVNNQITAIAYKKLF